MAGAPNVTPSWSVNASTHPREGSVLRGDPAASLDHGTLGGKRPLRGRPAAICPWRKLLGAGDCACSALILRSPSSRCEDGRLEGRGRARWRRLRSWPMVRDARAAPALLTMRE